MECQKVENKGGIDDGLLGGGKYSDGEYHGWRWTHDNSYFYWALKAAEAWATKECDETFISECVHSSQKIIDGINDYLYNSEIGVWHVAIDQSGNAVNNAHLSCLNNGAEAYPSWIQYAPQMLDLPVNGTNCQKVANWIHQTFRPDDTSCMGCVGYECENGEVKIRKRKHPGFAFQAALSWFDTGHNTYAESAIQWAEDSGLWQTTPDLKGITGGWIDWVEIVPEPGKTAQWWQRFIDTSFYAIAAWSGGYDFKVEVPDKNCPPPNGPNGCCFIGTSGLW